MHPQPSVIGEPPERSEPSVSSATDIISQTVGSTTPAEKTPSRRPSRRGVQARPPTKTHDMSHHTRRSSFSRSDSSPCDSFFASEPPPPNVATAGLRVRQFIRPLQEKEELSAARVAIVTSGGTDVPLEREAVRYLTNTSAGNRGAGLCEQLLRLGYYVVLLTSVRAVKPFVRHLLPPHPMPHILDFLSFEGPHPQQQHTQHQEQSTPLVEETIASEGEVSVPPAAATSRRLAGQASGDGHEEAPISVLGSIVSSSSSFAEEDRGGEGSLPTSGVSNDHGLKVTSEEEGPWRLVFREPQADDDEGLGNASLEQLDALEWKLNPQQAAAALEVYRHSRDRLLCITYKTLVEYAFLLRAIVAGAASLRERLMVCSAAAVADFYVPHVVMSPHKLRISQQQEGASLADPMDGFTRESESVEIQGPARSVSGAGGSHPKRWFTETSFPGEEPKPPPEPTPTGAAPPSGEQHQQPQQSQPQHQHHMSLRLHVVPKMLLMRGTIEAKLARYLNKLQTYKLKEALL